MNRGKNSVFPDQLVHQENAAVPEFVQPVAGFFHSGVIQIIDRIAADMFRTGADREDRLGGRTQFLKQNPRHFLRLLDHGQSKCVAVLPEIEQRTVLPASRIDDFEQPVGLFAGLGEVHDGIEGLRRRPGGLDQPEDFLHLLLGNLIADEGSAAVVALEDSLLHQCAHRLAQRHVADADLDGELPFGRQDGAAREIADPDLLCDPLSGHIRLRHALFIHHGTTPVVLSISRLQYHRIRRYQMNFPGKRRFLLPADAYAVDFVQRHIGHVQVEPEDILSLVVAEGELKTGVAARGIGIVVQLIAILEGIIIPGAAGIKTHFADKHCGGRLREHTDSSVSRRPRSRLDDIIIGRAGTAILVGAPVGKAVPGDQRAEAVHGVADPVDIRGAERVGRAVQRAGFAPSGGFGPVVSHLVVHAEVRHQQPAPGVAVGSQHRGRLGGRIVCVVPRVQGQAGSDLLEVACTSRLAARFPRPGQGRQQHRSQNRDDRDHHQEFNQRKISFHSRLSVSG